MATAFTRPENALKRAEELLNVGHKQEAWDTMHRVITSRRNKAWNKTLESIILKYLDLCVDMRKGAREGLNQYKNICQQVNVTSLEDVIKHFMDQSLKNANVDDLEAAAGKKMPVDLMMLSYVYGPKVKDRSCDLNYLWETYRTVLEVLKNNPKLETLYATTARRAFQFCRQHKLSTEFRRLCDLTRNHLNRFRDRLDLSAPDSLQLYLETRFEQLKVATELGLWQEAFRSVEDIYDLMCLVKKQPNASLSVVYYVKLTEIFWISSSLLHHAYAWLKLFSLQKKFNKNLTPKDLQLIASSVVLAALSVPSHVGVDSVKMANLIGLDIKRESGSPLSREFLLTEMVSKGVLTCASGDVKELYNLLEHEFLPLEMASRVQPLLVKISKVGNFSQYVPAIEKQAALVLLKQVSRVYQSVRIEKLCKMVPFLDFAGLEKVSVEAVKMKFLAMKVDHLRGAVVFGTPGMESDELRDQLVNFSESLNESRGMIYPSREKAVVLPGLSEMVEKEHRRVLARRSVIEHRKQEQERVLEEMEKDEESKRLKLQKSVEEAERKRIAVEIELRRTERVQREMQLKKLEEEQESELAAKKQSKLNEKQELGKKLQKLGKMMDHLERAKREETSPLIESAYQLRLVEEQMFREREHLQEIEQSRLRHGKDVQEKNRLERMLEQKVLLQDRVMSRRQAEYDQLMAERAEKINSVLQQRRQEIEVQRKMVFYVSTERQRLEKLQQEEEARRLAEAAAPPAQAPPAKFVPWFRRGGASAAGGATDRNRW